MDNKQLNESVDTTHWHTLYYRGQSVGSYRLKPGSDKREIEFIPLAPIHLKDTDIAVYLRKHFQDLTLDDQGGITVKLGFNRSLGPVARHIAYLYNYQQEAHP